MQKLKLKTVSAMTLISLIIPWHIQAGKDETPKQVVMMVPVGIENAQQVAGMEKMILEIKKHLGASFYILDTATTEQIIKNVKPEEFDSKLSQAIHLMNDSLKSYAAFKTKPEEIVQTLHVVEKYIRDEVEPSLTAAQLLVSARLTLAWLLFNSRQKEESKEALHHLLSLTDSSNLDLSYYPPAFRKFVRQAAQESPSKNAVLATSSTPTSVNVFVDHVFVGTSPLTLSLPHDHYTIGFSSGGRKTVTKEINLIEQEKQNLKVHLPWKEGRKTSYPSHTANWNKLGQSKKMPLAATVSHAAQADKTVFFSVKKSQTGWTPEVTVYDAHYAQMTKPLSRANSITDSASQEDNMSKFFAKKLKPLLSSNSVTFWSSHLNKDFIVDYRIATRAKKPVFKNPVFWTAAGIVAAAGTGAVLALTQGRDAARKTGGVTVSFDGF